MLDISQEYKIGAWQKVKRKGLRKYLFREIESVSDSCFWLLICLEFVPDSFKTQEIFNEAICIRLTSFLLSPIASRSKISGIRQWVSDSLYWHFSQTASEHKRGVLKQLRITHGPWYVSLINSRSKRYTTI